MILASLYRSREGASTVTRVASATSHWTIVSSAREHFIPAK
jgi:hypothetical protein